MAGRHSSGQRSHSRVLPVGLGVLAAIVVAVAGFVLLTDGPDERPTASGCSGSHPVRVVAVPELESAVVTATDTLEEQEAAVEGTCIDYQVEARPAAEAAGSLAGQAPLLWLPDSSLWFARAGADTPEVLTRSLATTPVVLASPEGTAPESWFDLLSDGRFVMEDPLTSSAGAAALLGVRAEQPRSGATDDEVGAVLVPVAQGFGADDRRRTTGHLVDAATGSTVAVVTEQQLFAAQEDGRARGLVPVVPSTGTLVLDHPMAMVGDDDRTHAAGEELAAYLTGEDGTNLLAAQGFRDPQLRPTGSSGGAGDVQPLPAPEQQVVEQTLRQWAVLTVPSRSLAVFDVSGSMDAMATGGTRISLAVEAATRGLRLFPDTAQIGIWAFSQGLGGPDQDHRPLVRIRRLDAPVAAGTQRDALEAALAELPSLTTGGTGLYDTTLAALRVVQDGYDADAINSVVLLTDGENEDTGSLTIRQLLRTIEEERDPDRPVSVVAIGMGPEADAEALQRIATATGGRSYLARRPGDITEVFRDALLSR